MTVASPQKKRNPRAFAKISKRDKQTDHVELAWPENFNDRPFSIPSFNIDSRPREDHAAGGGRIDPISMMLRWRPSSPNAGDELGFEAN